jgi:hypothetical protein
MRMFVMDLAGFDRPALVGSNSDPLEHRERRG